MKKLISALCLIAVLVSLFAPVGALASAADKNQVTKSTGTIYYDANGEEVKGASSLSGSAIVSVKKTATQHKDTSGNPIENQFLMELQVRTTQKLLELSSSSPDAAVTLILDVSSSMTECIHCGHRQTESCHNGNNKRCNQYKSRISETQAAANAFLDSFAKMGIDAGETNPPRRMVSIVTFAMDAEVHKVLNQTYIDVSNSSNLAAAKSVINGLKTESGTNIEGGLRLARNIMTEARKTNGTIAGIDYLYTILLSDGEPSACIYPETNANRNSLTKIDGGWDNDGNFLGDTSTNWEDINEVVSEVNTIKAFSSQSRFFSICLGREINHNNNTTNATLQMKPFSNWNDLGLTQNTTIEQWLKSFSTAVFGTYATADDITGNFNSVMSQIQLAAQAWRVDDKMGPDVDYVSSYPVTYNNQTINNVASYDQSTDTLTWNLLQSATDPRISSSGTTNAILGYTFRYIVELDNLKSGYSHTGEHATNAHALLDYAVKTDNGEWTTEGTLDKPFFEPKVESYTGSLRFRKVDEDGEPIHGMNFTLKTDDKVSWVMETEPSDENGYVEFTNIPSGHTYRLDEETMLGYAPVGDVNFSVQWSNVSVPSNSLLKNNNDTLTLTNHTYEHENNEINLTLNKSFYVTNGTTETLMPAAALADISKSYAYFNLTYPSRPGEDNPVEQIYLNGSKLTNSFDGLDEGIHSIVELSAPVEGYALVRTDITAEDSLGDTAFNINAASKTVSFNADRDPAREHNFTVNYKNVYRQLTGSISVRKSFEAHSLDTHTCDPNAGAFPGNANGVTATVALYKANALSGEPYAMVTLSSANSWTGTFANVPAGDYVIREISIDGTVTDYDFAHGRFVSVTKNGQSSALDLAADTNTYRFTVADGDRYGFNLENHYERENGRLSVFKNIVLNDGTQDSDTSDADRFVELYQQQNNNANPQITVNVYAGSAATGTPVATLNLHEGNDWQGTTGALPTGTYTIVENTPPALNGYELAAAASRTVTITEAHQQEPLSATLTNTYTLKSGALEVVKHFHNDFIPPALLNKQIPIQIVRTSDRSVFTTVYLSASSNWKATAENVPFDEYELVEVISSSAQNSAHVPDFSLKAQWSYNGTPQDISKGPAFVTDANWEQAGGQTISRIVTNTYSDTIHHLTVEKTFASGSALNADTVPEGYAVSIDISRLKDGSNTETDPSFELGRIQLNAANGFSSFAEMPTGRYLISETVVNAPEGYTNTPSFTLLDAGTGEPSTENDHIHFNPQTRVLEVEDHEGGHSALKLTVTNSYTADPASLTVRKSFAGQLDWELFNTRVFAVDLYEKNESDQDTLVNTLELKKNSDSDDPLLSFVATVDDLSADKTYYLVERNYDLSNYTDTVHWQMGSQNLTDYTNRATSIPFTLQPGSSVTAVVTNTYNRATGGLTVQKEYDFGSGETASAEDIAANTVTLTFTPKDGGQIGQKDAFSVTLTGATSVSRTNIPAGTYVVTESNANTLDNYTHTGTTYKIDGGSAQTGSAEVTIPEGASANVSVLVTNTYSRNTAKITLSKTFSGDLASSLVDSVTFSIMQGGEEAASVRVNAGNRWQGEAVLPTGTYTITETVTLKANAPYALTNYIHTPVWTSSIASSSGSAMTSNDNGVATVVLGNGDQADVALAIDNKYDFISGTITVNKDVAGVLSENDAALAGKEFFVDVYNAEGEKQGDTLKLNKDNSFEATTGELAANQYYYLVESGAPGIQDFTHTTQWLFANGGAFSDAENPAKSTSFLLQTNAHVDFTVRNTYARENGQPLSISKQFVFSDGAAVDVSEAKVSVTFTPENPALQGDPVTVELTGTAAQTVSLPVGSYTLSEDITTVNDFADYTYSRVRFLVDGSEVTNNTINVTSAAAIAVVAENSYTRNASMVTLSKTISGDLTEDLVESVTFTIKDASGNPVASVPVSATSETPWTGNVALPTGTYTVSETVTLKQDAPYALDAYTHTPAWTQTSTGTSALTVDPATGVASFTLENGDTAALVLSLDNNYVLKHVGVTFTKEFVGYAAADMPAEVIFTLTSVEDASEVYTVQLPAEDGTWQKTIDVPEGVYTVSEQFTAPGAGKRVVTSFPDLTDNVVNVVPGTPVVVRCVNRLDNAFTVRIPFTKTIVQGGTMPAYEQAQFRFLVDATLPAGVSLNFGAASGGSILHYNARTGALDVVMDNPVEFRGFMEITGFGDALADVRVSISEDLYPYASADDALQAGWTYDSASYTLSLAGSTVSGVKGVLTSNGKPTSCAAFTNTFTEYLPEIPQTGDHSSLVLWLLTLIGSGAAILLVRKRKVSHN